MFKILFSLVVPFIITGSTQSQIIFSENFAANASGFTYADNVFNNAINGAYASGAWSATGGTNNSGSLKVKLGGVDSKTKTNISGGWVKTFTLTAPQTVLLSFKYSMLQSGKYEQSEISEVRAEVDNQPISISVKTHIDQLKGMGNLTTTIGSTTLFEFKKAIQLSAGTHTLEIGGYNSGKTDNTEFTDYVLDDISLTSIIDPCSNPKNSNAQYIVSQANFISYKNTIQNIASFGDRSQLNATSSTSYLNAEAWLTGQLQNMGYVVNFTNYLYNGNQRRCIYVDKVGSVNPDKMYVVSGHFDGRGGGGGANDNASGSAAIFEVAKVLADTNVTVATTIRMMFWTSEEIGLVGSKGYVTSQKSLQGIENPVGSGKYPEPTWLGVIALDQILFDHGLPAQTAQILAADFDIEYQASSTFAAQSKLLADKVKASSIKFATQYSGEVSNNMNNTDSYAFINSCATISIRDSKRISEIGNGSNPTWHQLSDVYTYFSENDFLLGFNVVQTLLGFVANVDDITIANYSCGNQTINRQLLQTTEVNDVSILEPTYSKEGEALIYFQFDKRIYNSNEFIIYNEVNTKSPYKFSIYPNPVQNQIKLHYIGKIPSQNLFNIYNLNGQLLRSFEYDRHEYHNDMQIDVRNLPKGTYILKDEFGSYCKFTKF